MKKHCLALVLGILLLAGCNGGLPATQPTTPKNTATAPSASQTDVGTAQPPVSGSPTPSGPVTLRIWVPPQFDPAADTPAGNLLQARLELFSKRRPGVNIEVRVKAVSGVGGLLDSLSTTSAAAPLAMPDLIALPRDLLETAALNGLLHPYDELSTYPDYTDWYSYSRELARIQNSVYGLPFAGDALILIYHTQKLETPPADWATTLEAAMPLVFPVADPQALFTLTLYQASGGAVVDEQGRPSLDSEVLSGVFSFFQQAESSGVMPYWLTQYQSDDQVWEAFLEQRSDMMATWASSYLADPPAEIAAAPLPTQDGKPYTLAAGWVWAMATTDSEKRPLSVELAEFLIDSDFMAGWTQAVGYLPTRPSALRSWTDDSQISVFNRILLSARLLPQADLLNSLGLPLQQAAVQVLKQQADPLTAAQAAAAGLPEP